jgi:trk system potassium uptake protein TrkA
MRVIIVGCGGVGSALAFQLSKKGHQVTIIDQYKFAFDNLPIDFKGKVIEGDVLTRNVWQRAEVDKADALAAVTSSDSLNVLVAHIAKTEFQVERVVARNIDPRQQSLQEAFNVPIVGAASWGAQRVEELLTDSPLHAALVDQQAGFAIYHLEIPASWDGRPLEVLLPKGHYELLSWTRNGKPITIESAAVLAGGDLIYLRAAPDEIEHLRNNLGPEQEKPA